MGKSKFYEKHSAGWEREVAKATEKLEDQMEDLEDDEEERTHRKKTIDLGELYNTINLQTSNRQVHSHDFDERVEAYEQAMAQDQKEDEETAKKVEED